MLNGRSYAASIMVVAAWMAFSPGVVSVAEPLLNTDSYGIKRFTTEDGLPQNTVRFLLQARDGYIWVGTSCGVARYDGVRFTTYTDELLTSNSHDPRVADLVEDGNSRIWARTGECLASFYHGRWESFSCQESPFNGVIQACCASRDGGLWVAMKDGIKRFKNGQVVRVITRKDGLFSNSVGQLIEDSQGLLWICFVEPENNASRWQRLNPNTGAVTELGSIIVRQPGEQCAIVPDAAGGFWVCGASQFMKFDQDQVEHYPAPKILRAHSLAHIAQSEDGSLWFLVPGVSRVFEFSKGSCSAVDLPSLPSNDLRCVMTDREGLVWIGTGDAGLIQLRPKQFRCLLTTNAFGEKQEVFSTTPSRSGGIWIGTSAGLVRLQNGALRRYTNNCANRSGHFEDSIGAVVEDRGGRVWFGVKDEGLKTLAGEQFKPEPVGVFGVSDSWTASSLLEDSAGNLWVGSEHGLVRRTPEGRFIRVSTETDFADKPINGIAQGPDGTVWVGTMEAGIHWIRRDQSGRFTTHEGLLDNRAGPLCVDEDGTLWVGTSKGLNRIRNGRIDTVTTKTGLFDDQLYSLLDDTHGRYWATCNRGVFLVSKTELNSAADGLSDLVNCVSFGRLDGLASTECNGECQPNAARTPDGHLWFATTRGCATIDVNNMKSKHVPPPVVIEAVIADDKPVYSEGALDLNDTEEARMAPPRLPAGRGRVLEIRYTANSFFAPHKVRFRHRLLGNDPTWRDAGPQRVAFYTDLSPGDYSFEVKACTDQGVWSISPATFAFVLQPHFWQTWTFLLISGVTIIGLAVALQAYRLQWQHRLLKLDEQRALASERARIARDLHDDLGTALTGLALELDLFARESGNRPSLFARLGQTAKRTRELADRMREVVWTINPRCDTVLSLAAFLEQQVSQFLASDSVSVRLNFPQDIPPLPLGAEARHQLALSVREALNNVVRHARATEVNLSLELRSDGLALEIADNGCGFQQSNAKGYGLINMRSRMGEIGGSFSCKSEPGRGTTIRLSIPLPRRDAYTEGSSKI
jgi:signal transduction histidine kinase/ligand-binding sensor domain-containing protein